MTTAPVDDIALAAAAFLTADTPRNAVVRFRTVSALDQPRDRITRATLHATAHGVYEASLDGEPVTESVLNPGWTSYEWRLAYQTFDVRGQLAAGSGSELRLELLLADGWYRGDLGFARANANYGDEISVAAALTIEYADGSQQTIATGPEWTAEDSGIRSSLYNGQTIDARGAAGPLEARVTDIDRRTLFPQSAPLVMRQETLKPMSVQLSPSGSVLVDFGQNLVGWVRCTVQGESGHEVTLRHAEVLEDGELGTRPLRGAAATDVFVLSGGLDTFEPTLTFHGFRYVEVSGWPGDIDLDSFEAVVVHSEMKRIGTFECSEPLVNQLIHNSVWGQKGNFLSVPTDCPQRDERLGWTGDIAAYAASAAFQFDSADFLDGWLRDLFVETEHADGGIVPLTVPDVLKYANFPDGFSLPWHRATAVWGDAAVWVPQALWHAYGDRERLAAHYPAMVLHLGSAERDVSASGLWDLGNQLGDWLDPDAPPEDPAAAKADPSVVATACLYRSASFAAEAATILGADEDAARWRRLAETTRAAFNQHYVDGGIVLSDCATVYALAIVFGLLDDPDLARAGDRLAELVRAADYRVTTGFAGTPFVTWALSETGHVDDAYALLLERECPSWLYPITMGATTIWERWDSMLPDGTVNAGEMTSFNHYALGAVADWVYQVVGGVRPAEPGYSRVRIQPVPGPGITWARTRLETPRGVVSCEWELVDGEFTIHSSLPDGVEGDLVLPDGSAVRTIDGETRWRCDLR
ncbi:family 78 glycoside hydrolase catalytic domain [Microbacterium aoyamense]|uniref:alpha-L-rhamnosidase n=1 Tax=Microbacterium aoyamense TaxID=344166 RepID=A0ABN2PDK2_9MICO|nr:alpha-L-rhamnosidase [Microbacterium aoyamense]